MIFVKFLLVASTLLILWLSYPSPPASLCKEADQVHQVQVVPPGLACRTGCHLAPLLQQVDCDVLGMEEVGQSWLLLVTCSSSEEEKVEWGEVRCDFCGEKGVDIDSCHLSYSFAGEEEQEADKKFVLFNYDTILALLLVGVLILLGYLMTRDLKKEKEIVRVRLVGVEQQDMQELRNQEVKVATKKERSLSMTNIEGRQASMFQLDHSQLKQKSKKRKPKATS